MQSEMLDEIPPYQYTLLARNNIAAFVGLPDGRIIGLRTQHWAETKQDWFLEPLLLERGPLGMVVAPARDGRMGGRIVTLQTYRDGVSGLSVSCYYEPPLRQDELGQWYVLPEA